MPTIMSEDGNREAASRAQAVAWRRSVLATPPSEPRERELWLQHAAGYIFFEKIRAAGLATMSIDASDEVRSAVTLAVDATMYALMMHIDGVAGGPSGPGGSVDLTVGVELTKDGEVIERMDLRQGDGMCMGFHYWVDGDYGEDPVVEQE